MPNSSPLTSRERPTRDRILSFVRSSDQPVSPKQIIEHTGLPQNSVYTTVRMMLDEGQLVQPGYGLYDVPGDPRGQSDPSEGQRARGEHARGDNAQDARDGDEREGGDGQTGAPSGASNGAEASGPPVEASGLVYVPLSSVSASGGHGEEPFQQEINGYVAYDRAQIRRETGVDPSRLVVLPITGNSMEPTLRPGDRVIIARYRGEPIVDGTIYVLRRDVQGVVIKRAYWTSGGTLLLRSDNRDAPVDMEVDPSDEDAWQIIGRVVRVEKNL